MRSLQLVPVLIALMGTFLPAADVPVTATGGRMVDRKIAAKALAGTKVQWAAGPVTLTDALARLAVDGNRVQLADGLDAAQRAEVPAVDGLWWTGVDAVAKAFRLTLAPSHGHGEEKNTSMEIVDGRPEFSQPLLVSSGIPVLGPDQSGQVALAVTAGAGRIEWRIPEIVVSGRGRTLNGHRLVRIEPRLAEFGQVAATLLHLQTPDPEVDPGNQMILRRPARSPHDDVLDLADDGAIAARMHLQVNTAWSASAALAADDRLLVKVGSTTVTISRTGSELKAEWSGSLKLTTLAAEADGKALEDSGRSSRSGGQTNVLSLALSAMPDDAIQVLLAGDVPGARSSQPLGLIDTTQLPGTAVTTSATVSAHLPSRIRWAAGSRSLAAAVAALQVEGNSLILPFEVDSRLERPLPAWDGIWWEAVALVARTWDLGIAPPISVDGPVTLNPGRRPVGTAGIFLIIPERVERRAIHTSAGIEQQAVVHLRLVAEPRLAMSLDSVDFSWVSPIAAGGSLVTIADATEGQGVPNPFSDPFARAFNAPDHDTGTAPAGRVITCTLGHLPAGPLDLTLTGMLRTGIQADIPASAVVTLGKPGAILVGGNLIQVELLDPESVMRRIPFIRGLADNRACLLISHDPGQQRWFHLAVSGADGSAIPSRLLHSMVTGQVHVLTIAPTGPVTVNFPVTESYGNLTIPVTIPLTLP